MMSDSKIPLTSRAKRPAFFEQSGVDPLITMTTEIMAELWVLKERFYALEKVLDESGLDVKARIEHCKFSDEETAELEQTRRSFIESIMRAFEAESISRDEIQKQSDQFTESMKRGDQSQKS